MTQTDKEKLRMAKNLVKSNNKKIKKALELIRAFEPIGVYISDDPHQVEVLMEDLKEILEE